ncbi:MAG: rplI [Gammaproteobacteria bacterium]|jgi:large subunit ribosomal protein L9|nr:rplI [Gammaproteobacteria bacterium]
MKVILVESVRGLGKMGEVVNVRPGYGRNFLIPQQKAVSATAANLSKFEAQRAELERKAKEALAVAEKQAAQINGKTISVAAKTGDEGRLFGSIGTSDIVRLVKENFDIQVARSEVKMPHGAIRQTGEHHIEIDLHSDVVATINIVVTAEV